MLWEVAQGDPYQLLAGLLAQRKGLASLPAIARRKGGKPWFPDCPDLPFSLSSSGGLALCAVGETELGADIEKVRPRSDKLPRYALGDREYEWYAARGRTWEDFYTLWTMKEARVKCTGEGLFPGGARAVSVPLQGPEETGLWEGFRFTTLSGEGWRGAICEMTGEKEGEK